MNDEVFTPPIRERLKLKRCAFGVYDPMAYENGFIDDCGEIATVMYKYEGSPEFFVCDLHDEEIQEHIYNDKK